jgi:hypothetical protein
VGRARCVVACAFLVISVVPLAGVAGAARPSQANPTPADTWADSVCGAVVSWRTDLGNAAMDATNAAQRVRKSSASAQAKEVKRQIVQFLDVAIQTTSTLQSNVGAIGEPPVTDGAAVQGAFLASVDQIVSFFQSSRDQSQAVSTKNAKRADRKLSSIAGAIARESEETQDLMESAVAKDASGELNGAVAAEPQCVDVVHDPT